MNIPIGATRTFNVETMGTDVHNTSRFNYGAVKLALTYGGDVFHDEVKNNDPFEGGDVFTPSGERTVGGAFVQSRLTFFDKIDLITALRYDTYNLSGIVVTSGGTQDLETDGDRVSPKITLGVTPVKGITVFGTYAEGYRAPAVTESFVSGFHPAPGPPFEFLPNPFLRPEVAHNFEVGVNFKYNSIVTTGDAFRARVVAFRNKVDDFIDPTLDPTYQSRAVRSRMEPSATSISRRQPWKASSSRPCTMQKAGSQGWPRIASAAPTRIPERVSIRFRPIVWS